jgi:hypothetical protein
VRNQVISSLVGLWFFPGTGSAYAQKVNTDWNHETNFSNYKTYAWLESKHPAPSSLTNRRIIENIEKQLAAKGLRKATNNPDLFVAYNAGVKKQEGGKSTTGRGGDDVQLGCRTPGHSGH